MKESILNLIIRRPHASLFELSERVPGFTGNLIWYINTNTIIWPECSEQAVKAMKSLVQEGKIIPVATTPWVYVFDGMIPYIPVAKSLTKNYKLPHWLPLEFSVPGYKIEPWIDGVLNLNESKWRNSLK